MSLAVLIPYRPDSPHRRRIYEVTSRLWAAQGIEPIYSDDGLQGLFSYSRAANRARKMTGAEALIVYNVDALPLSPQALGTLEDKLCGGMPWTVLFDGQQRFTVKQTDALIEGVDPVQVGPAQGQICMGREALLGVRADVWDELRGMDERFIGWGPEDNAWHKVLSMVYRFGNDIPEYGLFQSLWHPDVSRALWPTNAELYLRYGFPQSAGAMKDWYLDRP